MNSDASWTVLKYVHILHQFPSGPAAGRPPGMEIWSNPLILNLSQFQEADRHGTGSQRSLFETGRAGRHLAADPKTGGERFFQIFHGN